MASRIEAPSGDISEGASNPTRSGRNRRRIRAVFPRRAAAAAVRSSSARLSSVIRTPSRIARSRSASSFIGPFSEIRSGSVPAPERRLELTGAKDVAARPLVRENATKRERGVRLDRGQQQQLTRPAGGEGGLDSGARFGEADPRRRRRAACRTARANSRARQPSTKSSPSRIDRHSSRRSTASLIVRSPRPARARAPRRAARSPAPAETLPVAGGRDDDAAAALEHEALVRRVRVEAGLGAARRRASGGGRSRRPRRRGGGPHPGSAAAGLIRVGERAARV